MYRYTGPNPKNKSKYSDKLWAVGVFKSGNLTQLVRAWGAWPKLSNWQVDAVHSHGMSVAIASELSDVKIIEGYHPLVSGPEYSAALAFVGNLRMHLSLDSVVGDKLVKLVDESGGVGNTCNCGHHGDHHGTEGCIYGNCICRFDHAVACKYCWVVKHAPVIAKEERDSFFTQQCQRCPRTVGMHASGHPHNAVGCSSLVLSAPLTIGVETSKTEAQPEHGWITAMRAGKCPNCWVHQGQHDIVDTYRGTTPTAEALWSVVCTRCHTRVGTHRRTHPHESAEGPGKCQGLVMPEMFAQPVPVKEDEPSIRRAPRRITHLLPRDL